MSAVANLGKIAHILMKDATVCSRLFLSCFDWRLIFVGPRSVSSVADSRFAGKRAWRCLGLKFCSGKLRFCLFWLTDFQGALH